MYSCQMSVEQALKAILILFGIKYPKIHDISAIYINIKAKDLLKNQKSVNDEEDNSKI